MPKLTEREFTAIMAFFNSEFQKYPDKFLSLLETCRNWVTTGRDRNKIACSISEQIEQILKDQHPSINCELDSRVNAIFRFQIQLPKECHQILVNKGYAQIDGNGILTEYNGNNLQLGEPTSENVIRYLKELISDSLHPKTMEELAIGFVEWTRPRSSPVETDPYLTARIRQILKKDLHITETIPIFDRVKIFMMTGIPVNQIFYSRIKKDAVIDEERRIVSCKNSEIELEQNYDLNQNDEIQLIKRKLTIIKGISEDQKLRYFRILEELSMTEGSPLSSQEIEDAYKTKFDDDDKTRIKHMLCKIPQLNLEIAECVGMEENSKIRMLFLTQTPVNDYFHGRLHQLRNGITGLWLDRSKRIIKFESKHPDFEMRLEREVVWNRSSTLNPLPWGEMEVKQFFDFIGSEINKPSTLDLQSLCEKFKEANQTRRSIEQLFEKAHSHFSGNMSNLKNFNFQQKVRALFVFGIPPHVEILKKLYSKITFQVDAEKRLTYCKFVSKTFGEYDESRHLSSPNENYIHFLKYISNRTTPMKLYQLVDEFLRIYEHFDSKRNVELYFETLNTRMLFDKVADEDTLLRIFFITHIPVHKDVIKLLTCYKLSLTKDNRITSFVHKNSSLVLKKKKSEACKSERKRKKLISNAPSRGTKVRKTLRSSRLPSIVNPEVEEDDTTPPAPMSHEETDANSDAEAPADEEQVAYPRNDVDIGFDDFVERENFLQEHNEISNAGVPEQEQSCNSEESAVMCRTAKPITHEQPQDADTGHNGSSTFPTHNKKETIGYLLQFSKCLFSGDREWPKLINLIERKHNQMNPDQRINSKDLLEKLKTSLDKIEISWTEGLNSTNSIMSCMVYQGFSRMISDLNSPVFKEIEDKLVVLRNTTREEQRTPFFTLRGTMKLLLIDVCNLHKTGI